MTLADLKRIEGGLGIKVPKDYRELMLSRAAELKAAGLDGILYLDADTIIITNLIQRKPDSGTGYAFPHWWKKFFLIGTDGAGDYYCLRLDRNRKVWMIGSDCGDKPIEMHGSLARFVEQELASNWPDKA
jgi:hypothetical protein